jgi:hypothetical protein
MVRFLSENFYLIAVAVAGTTYAITRWTTRTRGRAPTVALPGIVPAVAAGLLSSTLLVVTLVVLNPLAVIVYREGLLDLLLPPWVSTAGVTTLAVLTVYAIWPPHRPGDRSGAAARSLTGALVGVLGIVTIGGVIDSAAGRQAEAERIEDEAAETRAIEARSAALSIVVTVNDSRLGGTSQYGGRMVTHLTLDVEVRATNDVQLIDGEVGSNNWMNLSPETVSTIGVQPEEELALPTQLSAGFKASYRLEVPIDELRSESADRYTTGPWTARLSLYGAHDPGTPQVIYTTTTSFRVPEVQ